MFLAGAAVAGLAVRALALAARVGRRERRAGVLRRVLLLPHDSLDHAGARYRFAAWAERLRARGIRVRVRPPNTPWELQRLWSTATRRELLLSITFVRRLLAILGAARYDAVVYGRHAFPRFPYGGPEMERLLVALNPRTFLDVDDALWAAPKPPAGSGLLGGLLHRLTRTDRAEEAMSLVGGVLAGNERLAEHARGRNGNVHVIPTSVDPDRVPARKHGPSPRPVVGWIGTPGNLDHLAVAAPALRRVAKERDYVLRIVSSRPWSEPGVPVESVPWSAKTEAAAVAGFDVGLMPLLPRPGAESKCGLKLLQYAAAGVPAIASPIGVNREIVLHGETGFLAETGEEWASALARLLDDPELRERMGTRAREDARARWSYDAHEAAYLAALRGAR